MKVCKKCGKEDEESFFKRRSICNRCHLDSRKARYLNLSKEHKDELSKKNKKWRESNKDHVKDYHAKYRLSNKDKIKLEKKKYEKNRILIDAIYNLRRKMHSFIGKRFKNIGHQKRSRTSLIIGCSYKELYYFLGKKPDGICHIDHICPCSQAINEEEFIKLQHYTNLRWLKAEDNMVKSDGWTPEGEEMCRKLLNRDWINRDNKK